MTGEGRAQIPFGIRRHEASEVILLYEAARESIQEVNAWLPWCHPDYNMEDSSAWVSTRKEEWEEDRAYSFVIFYRDTGGIVGGVGLNQINRDFQMANLGYWVRTSCTGLGAATAATLLTAEYGFKELGLQRIEIVAAVGNKASQRVAEKAGAIKEGILRNRLLGHGKPTDAVLYSLLPQDLLSYRPPNDQLQMG